GFKNAYPRNQEEKTQSTADKIRSLPRIILCNDVGEHCAHQTNGCNDSSAPTPHLGRKDFRYEGYASPKFAGKSNTGNKPQHGVLWNRGDKTIGDVRQRVE